jgi:multisubunit Na+/H+ antiporter MnhB subunit
VYQGIIQSGQSAGGAWVIWLAAAMLGSALTLASFVKVLHAVFLRKPSESLAGRKTGEASAALALPTAVLALLCVLFGVLAYRWPLSMAVLPAVGEPLAFLGNWRAGEATVLLGLMIIGAIIAIETTNLLSSIVCVGAVGFLLSIAFLFLGAPDIAITQLVVEILCLVILIRATISRDLTTVSGDREFFGMVVTLALVLGVAVAGILVFAGFPAFGDPVMARVPETPSATYLACGLERTGAANIVASIILDFRAYDTLGEATVLFVSILGALTILRRVARKRPDEPDTEKTAHE